MKDWRLWIGILVSVLCLYLAARGIDLRGLLQALSHVNYVLLLPALGIVALGLWARAFRWRLLFYPLARLKLSRLFNVLCIGYLANNLLPFRAGDVLRSYLCAELQKLSVVRVLSTVVVERIADTLTILFLLLCIIPFVALPSELVRPARSVAALAILSMLILVCIAIQKERSLALFEGLVRRFGWLNREWLRRSVLSATDGLAALGVWRTALGVGAWSLLIWLSAALQFYLVMAATGVHAPFVAALVVLCLTSLGMTVPSAPGYIGVFEYLTVLSLSLFGVNKEAALGYALIAHAASYLAIAALGLAAAWAEGYSYASLRQAVSRPAHDAQSK